MSATGAHIGDHLSIRLARRDDIITARELANMALSNSPSLATAVDTAGCPDSGAHLLHLIRGDVQAAHAHFTTLRTPADLIASNTIVLVAEHKPTNTTVGMVCFGTPFVLTTMTINPNPLAADTRDRTEIIASTLLRINALAVTPTHQSAGIGATLLAAVHTLATAGKFTAIYGQCTSTGPLPKFYERHGFAVSQPGKWVDTQLESLGQVQLVSTDDPTEATFISRLGAVDPADITYVVDRFPWLPPPQGIGGEDFTFVTAEQPGASPPILCLAPEMRWAEDHRLTVHHNNKPATGPTATITTLALRISPPVRHQQTTAWLCRNDPQQHVDAASIAPLDAIPADWARKALATGYIQLINADTLIGYSQAPPRLFTGIVAVHEA